jgi:hypothetical protein
MHEAPDPSAHIIDALRLNERELAAIVARWSDREAAAAPNVRRTTRSERDLPRILVRICHQRGNCTTYIVKPRDIHEHGLVILHGSYVHEGAACFVILRDRDGQPTQLAATVFGCRHVSGRVHELVCVFNRPVRLREYQFADGTPLAPNGSDPAPQSPVSVATTH